MVNVHCSFSQDTSICQVLLFHNTEASSNPLGNIASVILRLVKQESGTCVGTLLAEDAMFIELHDGALPPVKPFDWTPFDTLPEEPHDITFNLPRLIHEPGFLFFLEIAVPTAQIAMRHVGASPHDLRFAWVLTEPGTSRSVSVTADAVEARGTLWRQIRDDEMPTANISLSGARR